jgi:hypothetical protein
LLPNGENDDLDLNGLVSMVSLCESTEVEEGGGLGIPLTLLKGEVDPGNGGGPEFVD